MTSYSVETKVGTTDSDIEDHICEAENERLTQGRSPWTAQIPTPSATLGGLDRSIDTRPL